MNNVLLIAFIIITLLLVAVLVWLVIEFKRLKQDFMVLREDVERNNKDIAGLCSAAVSVDSKLTDNNKQLDGIAKKVTDFEQLEQSASQPYHSAIQKVRSGADVDDLVQQCGLSREEAVLLKRLHG